MTYLTRITISLVLLFVVHARGEKKIKQGYLNPDYSADNLRRKKIFIGSMIASKCNFEKIQDLLNHNHQNPLLMDTLVCNFSSVVAFKLKFEIPEAKLDFNRAQCGEEYEHGISFHRLYG